MTQTDIFNGEILKKPPLFFVGRGLLPPLFYSDSRVPSIIKNVLYIKKKREQLLLSFWLD